MRKYLLFLAAAAALVACSKTEVIPEIAGDAETEITYTVAPKVRADVKDFDTDWKFKSYAFYLPNENEGTALTWASHTGATPSEYIVGQEISYNTTDLVWRNTEKKYYWPKAGKLTFFAWTNVKESRFVPTSPTSGPSTEYTFSSEDYISGVTVDATNGVQITDYDVAATANKNMDVLVADIKADQTQNVTTDYTNATTNTSDERSTIKEGNAYKGFNGVPTLFKHKLSKVYFTAKTAEDYKTVDGIKFYVNSIVFKGIAKQGTYTQGVDATNCTGAWTSQVSTAPQYYYSGLEGTSGEEVESTKEDIFNTDSQYYYMPQDFTNNAVFVVNYTIDYGNGVVENLSQTCNLADNSLQKFEISKFYTINLTFTLNEILWDPAVQEWETGSADVTINK